MNGTNSAFRILVAISSILLIVSCNETAPQNPEGEAMNNIFTNDDSELTGELAQIERDLEACIQEDFSTAGMAQCTAQAYEEWDENLNRIYNELRSQLTPAAEESLISAQLSWIEYRDKEFNFIDKIFSANEGTMYIPINEHARVSVVKTRTLELQRYLEAPIP